jgi:hypothetical protein
VRANPGRLLVFGAAALSLALVLAYLIAGGASYQPTQVQNPCDPRPWRSPQGIDEMAEQFTLSALDGAACELHVSRERLALALTSAEARQTFADEYGVTDADIEDAVHAGLARAVDDAEQAGALSPIIAGPLRAVVTRLPVDEAIALINDAKKVFEGSGDLLGQLGSIIP